MGIGIPRPLGPKKSQLSLGSQGYLYQPARSERYFLDDVRGILEFSDLTLVLAAVDGPQQNRFGLFRFGHLINPVVQASHPPEVPETFARSNPVGYRRPNE